MLTKLLGPPGKAGGSRAFANSPADFGRFVAEETEKLGKVIRAANINPE